MDNEDKLVRQDPTVTVDNFQEGLDAIHRKYFPPGGHRCYDTELDETLKMLARFGRTEEFGVIQDKQDSEITIRLCEENRELVKESAEQVLMLLNALKEVDLVTIRAKDLEAHLKKVTGRGPSEEEGALAPKSGVQP